MELFEIVDVESPIVNQKFAQLGRRDDIGPFSLLPFAAHRRGW